MRAARFTASVVLPTPSRSPVMTISLLAIGGLLNQPEGNEEHERGLSHFFIFMAEEEAEKRDRPQERDFRNDFSAAGLLDSGQDHGFPVVDLDFAGGFARGEPRYVDARNGCP